MVRFKVIKGSHLLLGAAIVILALVIAILLVDFVMSDSGVSTGVQANLVLEDQNEISEAETDMVFASLVVNQGALEFDPEMNERMNIEIIAEKTDAEKQDMPSILIYHTHTHEAYEQVANDRYEAIEAWRTYDQDHSVVRVGEELALLLRKYGFRVVHDVTDHEQDALGTAYTRSLETLESYEERFDLYIDLHRDAYIEGVSYDEIEVDGRSAAQLMVLIGNGEGFDIKPYYEENLAFASHLTGRINDLQPGLCKDVLVKDGRYNQNIGIFSILVEVGHNRNTLQEALNALPCLAEALNSLMIATPVTELAEAQRAFRERVG